MTINYILFYVYMVGAFIAFILGVIEGYLENKEGKDISEFPAGVVVMAFLSWYYVYHFVKTRIFV